MAPTRGHGRSRPGRRPPMHALALHAAVLKLIARMQAFR